MYYNTNNETGHTLNSSRNQAKSQEELIYSLFERNQNAYITPFEIHDLLETLSPITSIRRAISNLTKDGKLVKTDKMKEGPYGKKIHCWKFREESNA
tara:strand:+ start:400 stop:690 length:291 start_codon:yes stop_codon:yes gene_type:complete